MKEYLDCLLNSKVKLGYLHPVVKQAQCFLTSCDSTSSSESSINDLTDLLLNLTTSLKNNDICHKMDNSRDFLSLVITFENDLNDKIHMLSAMESASDHQTVIDTCKTIMKAWLQLILMWEKVQTKEINTLAARVKDSMVVVINNKNPEDLVKNFQGLCDIILTFKESASVYANQLYDSNSGRLLSLFENIARLLSPLSKTAELKFKYQGIMDDPKYLKYLKFCCDSLMFFVLEVTSTLKIPSNLTIDDSHQISETIPVFIDLIDQICDEVTLKDKPDVEKISKYLIALHWFCFKLVPLCSHVLHKRIMESMERLLDTQEEILKSKECSERILDELETLEKFVNMAILRILLEFSVYSYKEENKIMRNIILKVKEHQNQNLQQFQSDFLKHFEHLREFCKKLHLVIHIILHCCAFNSAKWWISVCAKRLTFVNEALLSCLKDYVEDPNNVATIHQLNLVKKEWDLVLKMTFNIIFTVIDASEFLKLIDTRMKSLLATIEDELEDDSELEQWKTNSQNVILYSKIALRVVEAFSMTKLGMNGRKALKLSSNKVICSLKTVNLYKSSYLENPRNEIVKGKMLSYFINLGKEIENLSSLCNDVKSTDIYNSETGSDLDDETKSEFGMSDIVNELTMEDTAEKTSLSSALEFVCSIISQNETNDAESKIFSSLSLDFVYELSKISVTELQKKQKKIKVQVKELLLELDEFSGSPILLSICNGICCYILQVLSINEEDVNLETNELFNNLNLAICETDNMRVLIELSGLMSHLKMISEEAESFNIAKKNTKTSCDMNLIVSKVTTLLKQLITMIEAAECSKILVNKTGNPKSLRRTFRRLGFNSTVGLFSEDV